MSAVDFSDVPGVCHLVEAYEDVVTRATDTIRQIYKVVQKNGYPVLFLG